jgi:hypothetical protein
VTLKTALALALVELALAGGLRFGLAPRHVQPLTPRAQALTLPSGTR